MGEEKRMTAEREAEIRAFVDRHPNGYYGELARELDAVRADLAELVAALPRCIHGNCDKPATRGHSTADPIVCDDHWMHRGRHYNRDCDWAPLLRRLAAKGASGE